MRKRAQEPLEAEGILPRSQTRKSTCITYVQRAENINLQIIFTLHFDRFTKKGEASGLENRASSTFHS